MEIQPRACSQGSQGRRGLGGRGSGWGEKVEPSTGEEGAERRDGCVAEEERGPGEGDLRSGKNPSARLLATLNFAVRENLKSTFREMEQLSAKSDLPVHVSQIGL